MNAHPSFAWALNLESDDERARGHGFNPSRKLVATLDAMASRLLGSLVREGDVVIPRAGTLDARGRVGLAWSPTPRALARLAACGAAVAPTPDEPVLRAVTSRAFAQSLTPVSPREILVTRESSSAFSPPAGPARVSLAHTCAGRGHWRCAGPTETLATIERLLARFEHVLVAPTVTVLADFALHGWVRRDGGAWLGEPTEQRVDPRTLAWRETRPTDALAAHERAALERAASEAAVALAAAGYFGPFGVDAFRYVDGAGERGFCPRGEVNARYTMGWATGARALREQIDRELLSSLSERR